MAQQPEEKDIEKMIRDYQMVQEQMRIFAIQLEQLKAQKVDLERAHQEVSGSSGKVFMSVGGIIIETTKEKAVTDLKDRSELADTRIKSITKQFDELKSREKQLSEKITEIYKAQGA